jgi:hypothetical protein
VRYRASGAIEAWAAARNVARQDGAILPANLADSRYSPLLLCPHQRNLIVRHSSRDFSTPTGRFTSQHADASVFSQAFWQRQGLSL